MDIQVDSQKVTIEFNEEYNKYISPYLLILLKRSIEEDNELTLTWDQFIQDYDVKHYMNCVLERLIVNTMIDFLDMVKDRLKAPENVRILQ